MSDNQIKITKCPKQEEHSQLDRIFNNRQPNPQEPKTKAEDNSE
jgi:hypothetical protein